MASGGRDWDAEYALSKLLQMGTVAEYHNEFEILINRVTRISEGLLKMFYISGLKPTLRCALLRSNQHPTTFSRRFSIACIGSKRFTNLQSWELLRSNPTTLGDAFFRARITEGHFEDENNQAVDDNVDEEGKNVEDQQVSKGDDDTNNDDVGYMRQPIEDESWFLAHEIDYPNNNDTRDQASELETKVLVDGKQDDVKVVGVTNEQNSDEPNMLKGNGIISVGVNENNNRVDKEVQYSIYILHVLIMLLKHLNDKYIKKKNIKAEIQRRIWNPGIKIFLDDPLRAWWFRRSRECYALGLE
ncbi:hypothetical protein Tco_1537983 [Tanacetum coccineum]